MTNPDDAAFIVFLRSHKGGMDEALRNAIREWNKAYNNHFPEDRTKTFAQKSFDYQLARDQFECDLAEAGFEDFDKLWSDYYDISLEFGGVSPDGRLSEAAQKVIFDAGFVMVFVNHTDGWETHYDIWKTGNVFTPSKGWRRKRVKSGFLISEWPEQWGDPENGNNSSWLKSGYMKIVGDGEKEPEQ